MEYAYFKRCWPARPAPGCYFPVKWTFIGLTSVKKVLMTMPAFQHVSSLPFVPKTRSVNRLFRIRTFFLNRFSIFRRQTKNTCFVERKKEKKNAAGRSIRLIKQMFFYDFYFLFLMPRPIFARPFWADFSDNFS